VASARRLGSWRSGPLLSSEPAFTQPPTERRYFHEVEQRWLINVPAENLYVTAEDVVLCTTLGSCVSACVHDPTAGLGALNHFLLPENPAGAALNEELRYGCHSMEQLLDELIEMGARRETLQAKIFGGGCSGSLGAGVGSANVAFVTKWLASERVNVVAQDVGGEWARQLRYYPVSGRARVRRLLMSRRPGVVREECGVAGRLILPPAIEDEE